MPLRKTAIAISEDLLSAVDHAAQSRGESRNQFVTLVLKEAVRARRGAEVTKRLNELFADTELAREQSRTAGEWDEVGTDWGNERW
jgi:metal-responsive CopG/Arc/MetJ family transcriptional regulator